MNTPITREKPILSNPLYNYLKYAVQIVLPALGTLYFTLAQIWGLPYGGEIVGTITAIALFGGIVLGVSKNSYDKSEQKFDGALNVDHAADEEFRLEFKQELPQLAEQDTVTLKVNKLSH